MKQNYEIVLLSLTVLVLVPHFSNGADKLTPEIFTNQSTHKPDLIVHEEVVEFSTTLPFLATTTTGPLPLLVSTENTSVHQSLSTITELSSEKISPTTIRSRASSQVEIVPGVAGQNLDRVDSNPSGKISNSIDNVATLPVSSDEHPIASPPLPVLTQDKPSVPGLIVDKPSTLPVLHPDKPLIIPVVVSHNISTASQPPSERDEHHPPPQEQVTPLPTLHSETTSELPAVPKGPFKPQHFYQSHELTIEEILKERPEDNGPIILRPPEVPHVEPVYVPAPRTLVTCPHCGQRQIWPRAEPCTHCPFCGHNVRSGINNVPQPQGPQREGVNSPRKNLRKSNPNLRNYDSNQVKLVPIQAHVNLDRRELLRRRLQHQRVSQYMKSISPEPLSSDVEGFIGGNQFEAKAEGNDHSPDSSIQESSGGDGSSFTSAISSWFFGSKDGHSQGWGSPTPSDKQIQPARQLRTEQVGQPTSRYFNCPFAKQQQR